MNNDDITALLAHAIPADDFEARLLAALAESTEDIAVNDTVRVLADVNGPDAVYAVTYVGDTTADIYNAYTGPVTVDRALIVRL